MIKAVFFDLFFTLITPTYNLEQNEYDILKLSQEEWESYAEESSLYNKRALGHITTSEQIIETIIETIPYTYSKEQKLQVLQAREQRMYNALNNVSEEIITTLKWLKAKGLKLYLISNADFIDCKHWVDSTLYPFFDDAIFSCNVGLLKPDKQIYQLALNRSNLNPDNCLYVGDGGSDELVGAKRAGMMTVFSEYLEKKPIDIRKNLSKVADYHITKFSQLINIAKKS